MEDQVGDFLKQLATSGRFQSALNGRQGAFQLIEWACKDRGVTDPPLPQQLDYLNAFKEHSIAWTLLNQKIDE